MRKTTFFLGCMGLTALFAACTPSSKGYTVEGLLPDSTMNGKTVYMLRVDDRKVMDSTVVDGNKITFTGVAPDTAFDCRVDLSRRSTSIFILENGNIKLNFENPYAPSGTPLNDELARVFAEQDSLISSYSVARKAFQGTPEEWADVEKNEWVPRMEQLILGLFEGHTNDGVGHALLSNLHGVEDIDKKLEVLNNLGPWLSSTKWATDMTTALNAEKLSAPGQPYIDVKGTTAEGDTVSLSDYVGKGDYVLVDMWASWCGPCKREIPNIANVYNLYKDKGLKVVGIFVWDKVENLAPAIASEGITWPQIIDSENVATKLYGVQGIPCIMLIGPDGTILDRTNLRGENMQPTIEKYMFGK